VTGHARILPIFDTHAHVLSDDRQAYPPAKEHEGAEVEPFTGEQLVAAMDETNVAKSCVVQRYFFYGTDNSYALDTAATNPDRLVPVVMLDSHDPDAPELLGRLVETRSVGGIRFSRPTFDTDDTGWLNSPRVMRLWERAAELGIAVAMIMFEPHQSYNLPALKLLAEEFPETPILIDHLGIRQGAIASVRRQRTEPGYVPYISTDDFGITDALRELRSCSNVHYKFTGINLGCLVADSIDPAEFLRRFADEFGADRVVCGTDIGQTEGPYSRLVDGFRQAMSGLTPAEAELVSFGNAERIYGRSAGR
jgi:predicted TIM-barrel fold metal-dependent hydrolase